jgi:hypothetical protein
VSLRNLSKDEICARFNNFWLNYDLETASFEIFVAKMLFEVDLY